MEKDGNFDKCFVLPFSLFKWAFNSFKWRKNTFTYFFEIGPTFTRSGRFPSVAETIIDYVLCCGLGFVPCLFRPLVLTLSAIPRNICNVLTLFLPSVKRNWKGIISPRVTRHLYMYSLIQNSDWMKRARAQTKSSKVCLYVKNVTWGRGRWWPFFSIPTNSVHYYLGILEPGTGY